MKTEILRGNDELVSIADDWNRLWADCRCSSANARAEIVTLFNQSFATGSRHCAITVHEGDRLVGLLPVNLQRNHGWMRTAVMPGNEWSQCGRLLLHPEADTKTACEAIADGLNKLRATSIWLDLINIDDRSWQSLLSSGKRMGWGIQLKERFAVGTVRLPDTWDEFLQSLSKNRRKRMKQEMRLLQDQGEVQFEECRGMNSDQLREAVQEAMEIELRSWKGETGSAVASNPQIRVYFNEWAMRLNGAGHLRLFFLKLNNQRIAFDLGTVANGTYGSQKISFVQEFARVSPGQILNGMVIRELIDVDHVHQIDTVGPMNEANQRWSNDQYRCGRIVMAPGSWLSNAPGRTVVTLLNARSVLRSPVDATGTV